MEKDLKQIIKNEIAPLLIGIRNDLEDNKKATQELSEEVKKKSNLEYELEVDDQYYKGKDGETPQQDIDYPSKETVLQFIKDNLPKKGKEYFTKKDIKDIMSDVFALIPSKEELKGKDGDNGQIDYSVVESLALPLIDKKYKAFKKDIEFVTKEVFKAIEDNKIPELSADKIRNKLESLKGNSRLDAKAIKGLEKYMTTFIATSSGGGGGIDLSNYVPYTGATTTLDLNNKDLNSVNTLEVKQATTNAVIIGDVSGNARGNGALDLQSNRVLVTNVASGSESVAVGVNNTASANRSNALGINNTASANYSQAFGYSNTATSDASTAVGYSNYAIGNYSSALGNSNYAEAYFSASVGSNNTASTYQGSAFGYGNTASANYSSAFGFLNHTEGVYSVALGANAQATSPSSLAIGSGTASGYYSSDLRTKATGNGSVSVGTNSGYYGTANTASGTYSQAFGVGNNASGNYSTTIGYGNAVSLDSSTAVGYGNAVYVTNSLALGVNISNNTANTIEIGASNASKIQLSSTYLRPFTDNQKTLGGITNRWTTIYGNGGLMLGYTAKTANYTLTATNYLVNCTANTFTITLPTAVAITGQIFIIKNSGTGIITLATTSSQTIDGVASGIFTLVQWDSITVTSNGANWIITN